MKHTLTAGAVLLGCATGALAQDLLLDTGNGDLDSVLRGASLVATLLDDTSETPRVQDLVAAARADYRRLLTGLYSEGYYGGTISILIDGQEASNIAPLDAPDAIGTIAISVVPGPQFRFGTASVAPLAPDTAPTDAFRTGEIARSGAVREAVAASVEAWRQAGYPKAAAADQTIIARHNDAELDASVTIDPERAAVFGPLTVSGNEAVRTEAIRRIVGYPEGQTFDPDTEEQVAERLRRTGAFASVAMIEGDTLLPDGRLPMTLQVAEMAPRRLGYGLELSSVEGLTVSGYWMHRNAMGGAQRLRVDGDVSGIAGETGGLDYHLDVSLTVPRPRAIDTELVAAVGLSHEDEPDYQLDQISVDATVTRILNRNREFSLGVGLVQARSEDSFGTRDYTLVTFPATGTIDRRDDTFDPSAGYYADLEITPFLGFGDSASGGRVVFDGRYYKSVGADSRLTFATRGQLGSLVGVAISEAPTDYLFYSGGGDSVRGEGYKSLGVTDGTTTTGGLSFAALSVEARYDLTQTIGVVGFYDTGFVGATEIPFEDGNWQSGAGLGLRYNTGIGPIRLDVATPVSGDSAGETISFYVGIGQAF